MTDDKTKEVLNIALELALHLIIEYMDNLTVEQFNKLHETIFYKIREYTKEQEKAYYESRRVQKMIEKEEIMGKTKEELEE